LYNNYRNTTKINEYIRAPELRVIGPEGENIGVISLSEALSKAREIGLDLIEISPTANPPVAKIGDFGKYQYEQNKKTKAGKVKSHVSEVKDIQVKIGTNENDLAIKAKRAGEWLRQGHRIKIELFLPGRTKYMEKSFLEERLERILKLIPENYKVTDSIKKSPKGLSMIIEKQK